MSCLWGAKDKKVGEVHECISSRRKIAYTTVMTIMTRLVDKGLLTRKRLGKAYSYSPRKTKKETTRSVVGNIFHSLVEQFGEEAVVAFSDEVDKASSKNG